MSSEEWYASLPSFLASAAALITDADGNILLVKPNYRPWWNLPGGVLEADEPPHEACMREVEEELGLIIEVGRLLVVDWSAPTSERPAWFGFVFDGGVLEDATQIRLQAEGLDAYEFVPPAGMAGRLNETVAARVVAALKVRDGAGTAYLSNGFAVA